MKALNAYWVTTDAMDAAVYLAMRIEGSLEDIQGAIDDGDFTSAFECSTIAANAIALISHILSSAPPSSDEVLILATLAYEDDDVLVAYGEADRATKQTRASAVARLAELHDAAAAARSLLPFDVPHMRTPEGFFPTVRVAKEFERLRARLGLSAFGWSFLEV